MSSRLATSFRVLLIPTLFLGVSTLALGTSRADQAKYIGPTDIVVGPAQKLIYVVAYDAQRIEVIDAATDKVVRGIACPTRPTGVAVKSDGSELYITCEGDPGVVCVACVGA